MSEIDELLKSLGFSANDKKLDQMHPSHIESPSHKSMVTAPMDLPPTKNKSRHSPSGTQSFSSMTHSESGPAGATTRGGRFMPIAPDSLEQAGLYTNEVSDLLLKSLILRGIETGFNLARKIGMKFPVVESILRQMKVNRQVSYRNSAAGGDYFYELTDLGRDRARSVQEVNSYIGTAPVPLAQYIESVKAQSLEGRRPALASIRNAFQDLQVEESLVSSLGQAIHSGRGMFLYGPAGNGKTSIAERVTKSFGDSIWIPRAISAAGEILRLYDPNRHTVTATAGDDSEFTDGRWVQIERPTIVAGGELRMENLEVTYIQRAGVGEAPLQMKANCGTLLIDDFGRQRMSVDELLNRWIVPLEQRYDYLHLESGRSIQVPFDELIIFSTNLQPKDLVDEAFLRRIPYKIEVKNPSEDSFRRLFTNLASSAGFRVEPNAVDYLIEKHYHGVGRTFRYCHPRDLLRQIENKCTLHELEFLVNVENIDEAIGNYFAIMVDEATREHL